MEQELFNPENVKIVRYNLGKDGNKALKQIKSWANKCQNIRSNLSKDEKKALKEIESWANQVRVQGKRFRFVIFENEIYEDKVQNQIDRSSFKELKDDSSKLFQ